MEQHKVTEIVTAAFTSSTFNQIERVDESFIEIDCLPLGMQTKEELFDSVELDSFKVNSDY